MSDTREVQDGLGGAGAAQPYIRALFPPTAKVGNTPAFTLRVFGATFRPGAYILINNVKVTTTFVSRNQLTAPLDLSAVGTPGVYPVRVRVGTALSRARLFTLQATTVPNRPITAPTAVKNTTVDVVVTFTASADGTVTGTKVTPMLAGVPQDHLAKTTTMPGTTATWLQTELPAGSWTFSYVYVNPQGSSAPSPESTTPIVLP
jgi:hypothetical protein